MEFNIRKLLRSGMMIGLGLGGLAASLEAAELTRPMATDGLVFEEANGVVAVEAEHFYKQTLTEKRAWHITSAKHQPKAEPDGDPAHLEGASGGVYVEVLPDTRRTHADKLIAGENFSNEPGKMAVLHYKVHFNTPGRYYVWARAYSTGGEDNGLHVGLNGEWPESGRRLQWCEGKNGWRWESRQRTEQVHCGEPNQIYLDIAKAGEHEIQFAMREDGFEFDKFLLTQNRELVRPEDSGPGVRVKAGTMPAAFVAQAAPAPVADKTKAPVQKAYPAHWGQPPQIQTRDYVPLPGGYGNGSSTLANWIKANLEKDQAVAVKPRQPDGKGKIEITGELKQWHKVTLTMDGPFARETDTEPNPFTDYRMTVTFTHESGEPSYTVPGYFAADGEAASTSATEGTKWRAHLAPDKAGRWKYEVNFVTGKQAAFGTNGTPIKIYDREKGRFKVEPSDKRGDDFRAKGRLQYVGGHYLRFAGNKEYFLKAGPDAPETLLAYADFDGTEALKKNVPLKTWQPHLRDWKAGDPTWKDGKGKGLIGAVNYLASKGLNVMSFLTYNAGGDGDNVWPFISRDDKLHYDCSKLDQWGVVFDHAQTKGIYLHFKLQENETDDNLKGHQLEPANIMEALDGGDLGIERKLYLRELIARYGYELALNWNLGEENTQTPAQQRAMAKFIADTDPYQHHIVVHTFPDFQDRVYPELLGDKSVLTGASLQNGWSAVHQRTLKWVEESAKAGKSWVVANDEQGPAGLGVPPDPGYDGFLGLARDKPTDKPYDLHSIRKHTLWGNLMAGGAGVEYYFGYKLPQNDLVCEDFRSRERSWSYCRVALSFFPAQNIPFWEMTNADALIGNEKRDNSKYCFAKADSVYLIYLPEGGTSELDLTAAKGKFAVKWFNPRSGGPLRNGSVSEVSGGGKVVLGQPPGDATEDWLVVVRK